MKIAIMQPYIFPYVGYFQLMHAVDRFIFYDDVHYIKKGWINRNRILINGDAKLFTVPVIKASQNKLINEIQCDLSEKWISGFQKTIHHNYKRAPYYSQTLSLIEEILLDTSVSIKISKLAAKSVKLIAEYLKMDTHLEFSSQKYTQTKGMEKGARLKAIVKKNQADNYINLIGGKELYDKDDFATDNINLEFLESGNIIYKQFSGNFIANLSIIDVLMFNSKQEINDFLNKYKLL